MNKLNFKYLLLLFLLSACSSKSDLWFGADKKLDMPGERISVIYNLKELVPNEKIEDKKFLTPQLVKNDGWYKSSGITSSQVENLYLNQPIAKEANYSVTGNDFFLLTSTPILVGDNLYVIGSDGIITAINTKTNSTIWSNDYFSKITQKSIFDTFARVFINGGISFADGKIYATAGYADVIAIEPENGKVIWSITLSSPTRATPLKVGNILIVQTTDNKSFALDAENGNIIWNHLGINEEINVLATFAPISIGDKVIIQYASGEVYALDASTGEEVWVASVSSGIDRVRAYDHLNIAITAPATDGRRVYTFSNDGVFGAFDIITGNPIWKHDLGINKQFWIAGKYIYAISNNKQLVSINIETGYIRWVSDLKYLVEVEKEVDTFFSAPVVADDKVIVASSNGKLLFFDMSNGNKIDDIEIDKDVYLNPVIANGDMFIMSNRGNITKY